MKFKTFQSLAVVGGCLAAFGGIFGACMLCAGPDRDEPDPKGKPAATAPPKAAATPQGPAATAGAPADSEPMRPMDREILDRVGRNIAGDKLKDAFPGRPYKVSLYKDAGFSKVNRLKIDLNRNEKWEEKWTLEDGAGQEKIKRQVAPKDDESYTVEYRLRAGVWEKKK